MSLPPPARRPRPRLCEQVYSTDNAYHKGSAADGFKIRHLRGDVEGKVLTMTVDMTRKTLTLAIGEDAPVETGVLPFPVCRCLFALWRRALTSIVCVPGGRHSVRFLRLEGRRRRAGGRRRATDEPAADAPVYRTEAVQAQRLESSESLRADVPWFGR